MAALDRLLVKIIGVAFTFLCVISPYKTSALKGGYWPAYSYSDSPPFPPSQISASLYTHLYYAFVDLDDQTLEVVVSVENEQSIQQFTAQVQTNNPSVKTLLSIAGGDTKFAKMAADASLRKAFIDSSIAVARNYSFHGLDLDWEYPTDMTEMNNLGQLLSEWRSAIEAEAQASGNDSLLLTAAVYFSHSFFTSNVDREYPSAVDKLDWLNIMAYDFHGPSGEPNRTAAHAALYDPNSHISTSFGVQSWLDAGLPSSKVVMGMPLYGYSWELQSAVEVGIGATATGAATGVGTDNGSVKYSAIRDFIRQNGATEVFDTTTVSAYCYAGLDWIGYDNDQSVARKVGFAKQEGLLGYFFWNVVQDTTDWALSRTASDTWDG